MACGVLPSQWAGCAGDLAGKAATSAFDNIAQAFGKLAGHAVTWLWTQIGTATAVRLGGPGFAQVTSIVAAISAVVAVALFVIQVTASALRRDPAGLSRAVKGLLVAFLAGGAAITVVNELLAATDALSAGVVHVVLGTGIAGLGRMILSGAVLTGAVFGSAGLLVISLGVLVVVTIVYAALVIRKVLLIVTAVFAPIAFAGSLADITVAWTRRWIEFTLALIFSKLVLVLIFITGYEALIRGAGQAGGGATQELTQTVAGLLILTVAGLAPWMAVKVVHFTGDHAQQLHGLGAGVASAPAAAGGVGRMAVKAAPAAAGVFSGGGLGATGVADLAGGLAAGGLAGMIGRLRGSGPGPGGLAGPGGNGAAARAGGPGPADGAFPASPAAPGTDGRRGGGTPGAQPPGTGWPGPVPAARPLPPATRPSGPGWPDEDGGLGLGAGGPRRG